MYNRERENIFWEDIKDIKPLQHLVSISKAGLENISAPRARRNNRTTHSKANTHTCEGKGYCEVCGKLLTSK